LDDPQKRDLFARTHAALRPGGVFVNAEQVLADTSWLREREREMWRESCRVAGASEAEIADAETRMEHDHCSGVPSQLDWMGAAGFEDRECFFKHLQFAVLAGWRASAAGRT
jgi:tRNA (cmo5U34)-methyltransferase